MKPWEVTSPSDEMENFRSSQIQVQVSLSHLLALSKWTHLLRSLSLLCLNCKRGTMTPTLWGCPKDDSRLCRQHAGYLPHSQSPKTVLRIIQGCILLKRWLLWTSLCLLWPLLLNKWTSVFIPVSYGPLAASFLFPAEI